MNCKIINSFEGKYSFLSNFFLAEVEYEGRIYGSSEAAYQAAKFLNEEIKDSFTKLNPSQSKKEARRLSKFIRADWLQINKKCMYEICKAKFTQNPKLGEELLKTGNATLIEGNWWNDTFWGQCKGVGENHLGKILMRIRAELLKESLNEEKGSL